MMRGFHVLYLIAGSVLGVHALTLVEVQKVKGEFVPDSYIVVLKNEIEPSAHLETLISSVSDIAGGNTEIVIEHKYNAVLKGYSAILKGAALEEVRKSSDVISIEQNAVVTTDNYNADTIAVDAKEIILQSEERTMESDVPELPWELNPNDLEAVDGKDNQGEQDQHGQCLPFGQGTDVFSLDTGVNIEHVDFGGRAVWGAVYIGGKWDRRGHGTHTSGTAVGNKYGIARNARLIAVKVLGDDGRGPVSAIIAGVDYAVRVMLSTRRSSVANMSLGFSGDSTALDAAIVNAIAAGLHVTASAGNSNMDAANQSPAKIPGVVTVGAIDALNKKAPFSNFGPIIDVHAPGVNITSAWIGSTTATGVLSGTSMAAPYVAGIISVELSRYGRRSPAQMSADLKHHALNVVTGVPPGTTRLKARLW